MTLPASRDLTLDGSTPIPASLMNRLQDCSTGMKKPEFWRYQVIPRGWVETNLTFPSTSTFGTGEINNNGGGTLDYGGPCLIDLLPGDRITGISAQILGTGGAQTVDVYLSRTYIGGGLISIGDVAHLTVSTPPNAWTKYSLLTPTYVVQDGDAFMWKIQLPLANTHAAQLGVRIDRL